MSSTDPAEIDGHLAMGGSAVVNAVPGAGKTTFVLNYVSKHPTDGPYLLLTYNKQLQQESAQRAAAMGIARHVDIMTIHASAGKLFGVRPANDDKALLDSLRSGSYKGPTYTLLFLDEAQDISALYYRQIKRIIGALRTPRLCVLGDPDQAVYDFKGGDRRFLTLADKIYGERDWRHFRLSQSWRCPRKIVEFVNKRYGTTIIARDADGELYRHNGDDLFKLERLLRDLLDKGVKHGEILITAETVKVENKAGPLARFYVNVHEKQSVVKPDEIYFQQNEITGADRDSAIDGKIAVLTHCSCKGLERRVVIVNTHTTTPNPASLYVALTRSKEKLYTYEPKSRDMEPDDKKKPIRVTELVQYQQNIAGLYDNLFRETHGILAQDQPFPQPLTKKYDSLVSGVMVAIGLQPSNLTRKAIEDRLKKEIGAADTLGKWALAVEEIFKAYEEADLEERRRLMAILNVMLGHGWIDCRFPEKTSQNLLSPQTIEICCADTDKLAFLHAIPGAEVCRERSLEWSNDSHQVWGRADVVVGDDLVIETKYVGQLKDEHRYQALAYAAMLGHPAPRAIVHDARKRAYIFIEQRVPGACQRFMDALIARYPIVKPCQGCDGDCGLDAEKLVCYRCDRSFMDTLPTAPVAAGDAPEETMEYGGPFDGFQETKGSFTIKTGGHPVDAATAFPRPEDPRFVAFIDTETTGLEDGDRVIDVAVVLRDYHTMTQRTITTLINPGGRKSSPEAQKVHGIDPRELESMPSFAKIADALLDFIGDTPIVAHNADFDARMINAELRRADKPALPANRFRCTMELAKAMKFRGGACTLATVTKNYGLAYDDTKHHSALYDATLAADLYPLLALGLRFPSKAASAPKKAATSKVGSK
jgi:DNA polymerase-3 subunit epsilon